MLAVLYGFTLTLIAYLLAKPINKKLPQLPIIVIGMFLIIGLLAVLGIPYESYMSYDQMKAAVADIKNSAKADRFVNLEVYGTTVQGRPMDM